jgi:hypothetical protein
MLAGCAAPPALVPPSTVPADSPQPTRSVEIERPAAIVVSATTVRVEGTAGSALFETDYEPQDTAATFARLGEVLGADVDGVVVPTPAPFCFDDTTEYDFGGIVFTVPGQYPAHIAGAFEAHVRAASTVDGIPITSTGGIHVGSTEAELTAAAGSVIELWSLDGVTAYGFDLITEQAGTQVAIKDGVVTDLFTPRWFFSDC